MRGRKTGIGVYTEQLMFALNEFAPLVEALALDDGATVDQRTDKRIYREQVALPRLALRGHADLLHLTGFAAPLHSRVPVVLTVMDMIGVLFSKNFPPASRFYWSRYLPYTLRAGKHIIALSQNTKRDVMAISRIPSERITVIPPGVDGHFRVNDDAAALGEVQARLRLPARFFLFVSTLEPRKGIDTLLDAFAKVSPLVAEHLVIVGKRGWNYETFFSQVRALNLETRVHLTDYASDEDLPALYNLATAFVFPSRYEGFGLTLLEAMACGAPVISSNAASMPEVVGEAGILLPPTDADAFARAMRQLAANESLRVELRERGLKRVESFSWKRAAVETAQCYERTINSPSVTH